jgi:hypothetical protein
MVFLATFFVLKFSLHLTQAKYVYHMLLLANLINREIAYTLIELNAHLNPQDGEPLRCPTLYPHLVDNLILLLLDMISHILSIK